MEVIAFSVSNILRQIIRRRRSRLAGPGRAALGGGRALGRAALGGGRPPGRPRPGSRPGGSGGRSGHSLFSFHFRNRPRVKSQ